MPVDPHSPRASSVPTSYAPEEASGLPAISYDEVPYPARAIAASHPERLATVLTLLGLRPPPLEKCRVLELGSATGGNLTPMAEALSGGLFVGLDRSPVQIDAARAVADRLGLKNVEFRCQDLMEYGISPSGTGSDAETFDFIIAHGVYSWVPAAARDRLLEICARRLAPGGVAYVSYNTYPGWQAHDVVREMMLSHIWGSGAEPGAAVPRTPQELIAKAREALDLLATTELTDGPYGAVLMETAAAVRSLPDANLLHDHLDPINHAVYVSQFVAHAASKGLHYLGDARPWRPPPAWREERRDKTNGRAEQRKAAAPPLDRFATTPLRAEQLADVLRNRPFRQSLLCRADAPPESLEPQRPAGDEPPGLLERARQRAAESAASRGSGAASTPPATEQGDFLATAGLVPDNVSRLYVGSAVVPPAPESESGTAAAEVFSTPQGTMITVSDPLLKGALRCLADVWPARLKFEALLDAARRRIGPGSAGSFGPDAGAARLCTALLDAFLAGAVELSVRAVHCAAAVSRRPSARRLARVQAETGDTVTTLRHENLRLNATARHLLVLLDGTRDFPAIASAVADILQDNARNIDPSLTLTEEDRRQLAQGLQQDLRRLAAEGVLVG